MKLLLVDGLNLIRRIFSAGNSDQVEANQELTERLVRTCVQSLDRALGFHKPSHAGCVFELSVETWRHRRFAGYKSGRKPMPDALAAAMEKIRNGFREQGVRSIEIPGFEADDVIASISRKVADNRGDVVILTTDRLHCQLLGPNISVYDHFNQRYLDRDYVLEKYQVEPNQIPDALGLSGDSGVSIPGVPGIGPKTAAALIREHGDLETVLTHSTDIPGKTGHNLRHHQDDARMAKALCTLKSDIVLGVNLKDFRLNTTNERD